MLEEAESCRMWNEAVIAYARADKSNVYLVGLGSKMYLRLVGRRRDNGMRYLENKQSCANHTLSHVLQTSLYCSLWMEMWGYFRYAFVQCKVQIVLNEGKQTGVM
jgi:hypothetical protein